MSSIENENQPSAPRRRFTREERLRQLLDQAWQLIRDEGTEALTLGRLAELAEVTKPVVYDHFGTRAGLLAALYREFDARQVKLMDESLQASEPTLTGKAAVVASAYINCCALSEGCGIPGVIAALAGSPELEKVKSEYDAAFIEKCRAVFSPFAQGGDITTARLRAMLGAAVALSSAAAAGEITPGQAEDELREVIVAMVERSCC